jgi:hypothetical protein
MRLRLPAQHDAARERQLERAAPSTRSGSAEDDGAIHSTNAGAERAGRSTRRLPSRRPRHFTKLLRGSFARRQNAVIDSPLCS